MFQRQLLILALFFSYTLCVSAQGLYVAPGTNFNILAGTDISIDSLVLSPSATFTITDNTITRNTVVVHPLGDTYISRVYHFTGITAPFTGSVVFGYADGAELNGLSEAALRLYVNNGSVWNPFFTGFVNDNVNNTLSVNGITAQQLNEITLASAGGVLPLTWLGIQAVRNKSDIKVQWQTAAEVDIDFYSVERSTDTRQWVTIASGIAPLLTAAVARYSLTDYGSSPGRLFYRVKQKAKNGAYNYSGIVAVMETVTDNNVEIYPNPTSDYFKVGSVAEAGLKEIQLINVAGNKVKSWKTLQISYDVTDLPAGMYHLVFIYNNKSVNTSFTKL